MICRLARGVTPRETTAGPFYRNVTSPSRRIPLVPAVVRRFGRGPGDRRAAATVVAVDGCDSPHVDRHGMRAGQRLDRPLALLLARRRAADGYRATGHFDREVARVDIDGCQAVEKLRADGFVAIVHGGLQVA